MIGPRLRVKLPGLRAKPKTLNPKPPGVEGLAVSGASFAEAGGAKGGKAGC